MVHENFLKIAYPLIISVGAGSIKGRVTGGHGWSIYHMTADGSNAQERFNWAEWSRDPRQELQNLLPAGLAFLLKGHDPLMEPGDRVSFGIGRGGGIVVLGLRTVIGGTDSFGRRGFSSNRL